MDITDKRIDGGKPFDWGRASVDYARYRDIYPPLFYEKILARGLCQNGQRVLDLGTGTGVLPRHLYAYGARWTGTDISREQIEQAKRLSVGMDIAYEALPAEEIIQIPHPEQLPPRKAAPLQKPLQQRRPRPRRNRQLKSGR